MASLLYRDGTCQLLPGLNTTDEPCDHGGSVFDCELVRSEEGVRALLFDCYSYSGVSYIKNSLTRRIAKCENFLAMCYAPQPGDPVTIVVKQYHKLCKENLYIFESYMSNSHMLKYNVDGVVIVPNSRRTGTKFLQDVQFKMKPAHTIDLIILEDEGDFYLASYDDNDDTFVTKCQLNEIPFGGSVNDIVECNMKVDGSLTLFEPLQLRPDKNHPNSEKVIELTINTVKDNISVHDLV